MKCGICGHRANNIKGMGEHYRKKHPNRMKHGRRRGVARRGRRSPTRYGDSGYTRKEWEKIIHEFVTQKLGF